MFLFCHASAFPLPVWTHTRGLSRVICQISRGDALLPKETSAFMDNVQWEAGLGGWDKKKKLNKNLKFELLNASFA